MINYVIFDIDGTLLDTEKAIIKSLQRVVHEEHDCVLKYEELTFSLGIPAMTTLSQLKIKNMEEAYKRWVRYIREDPHGVSIFPGIKETLENLKQRGIKSGVVTSKSGDEVNKDFLPYGLMEYMEFLVCTDDTKRHKPDPEPILKFLELSGTKPANAVYIGDTIYDKQCAQGAGVKFALAQWGARNPEKIGGDYLLEKPVDILNICK